MISAEFRRHLMLGTAAIAIAAAAFSEPVRAQNVSGGNANYINLLAPFLSLNSTAIGQQTLTADLQQAVLINQNASSPTGILNSPSQINPNAPSAAFLNGNLSTTAAAALAISDENALSSITNTVYGLSLSQTFGIAANLAGGLPTQNTTSYSTYTNGAQPVGGFGAVLGAAYVSGVYPGSGTTAASTLLPNTVTLLNTAFNFTGNVKNDGSSSVGDAQVAKFYFANGTWDGTHSAVAPAGYTLPTFTLSSPSTILPNTTNSVYDIAFGVTNTQTGQNQYGNSHPYQTYPAVSSTYTLYDPTVKTATTAPGAVNPDTPSSNPAFPSSHEAYTMTEGLLLGMLVPQFYQSMLVRASQTGESRIVVGVHYPTDIIGSRADISYDLAQYLSNPAYINNPAVTGVTGVSAVQGVNLPSLFGPAQSEITTYLNNYAVNNGCGTSLATCAVSAANTANDPFVPSATNAQIYGARLTYGLPILTFAQAPREQAPAGGPDASILLATVYGGSTFAAQTLAPGGGMDGNLSTSTINQIIVNTETDALAAFYGTSLSYWSRINLYDATGYFSGVTGTVTLAPGDKLNENVTIAGATTNVNGDVVAAGVLGGVGAITGNVLAQAGGTFAPGTPDAPGTFMTVTGNLAFQSGAFYMVDVNSTTSNFANVTGSATLGGNVVVAFAPGTSPLHHYTILQTGGLNGTTFAGVSLINAPNYSPSLTYTADNVLLNITARTATHDFNADGYSDILWRDTSGDNAIWLMNGGSIPSSASLYTISTAWSIVGQRDFNGDGMTDLLWHDTSGDIAIWFMNGTTVSSGVGLGTVNPAWSIVGTGDFNGDGKGDILWRDTSGDIATWLMNGSSILSSAGLGSLSTAWSVVGTGDFNGDGKSDILWQDTSGDIAIWFMNGTTVSSSVGLGTIAPPWTIVGTGDFNGDGMTDILWRNTSTGAIAVWLMDGSSILSSAGLGSIATNWSIVETGDFNGDGMSDILWRDTSGDAAIWFMNGTTVSSGVGLGTIPPAWSIQGAGAD